MWQDIEAEVDLLNFGVVARAAAGLIRAAKGAPLTIGISGGWGAGKSTLVKLIGAELVAKPGEDQGAALVLLNFNAWLYQGYEDARHALLDVVTDRLLEQVKSDETLLQKVKAFAKRIKVLKAVRFFAPVASHVAAGTALGGPVGALVGAVSGLVTATGELADRQEQFKAVQSAYSELEPELKELVDAKKERSLPKEIQGLRDAFEELLKELDVTLVVLVDDLDRCLPNTAISTLEAMRLLLHVKRTAFIIAADENMIRGAVKAHFKGVEIEEGQVTSYFDKLIQVPLSVPRLGVNEVKAYLVLLFADLAERTGSIDHKTHFQGRKVILDKLKKSWEGGFDSELFTKAFGDVAHLIAAELDIADQLAPLLVASEEIGGNPRLIKRFMNNLMLRRTIAADMDLTLPFAELVKVQLLERCATAVAFEFLAKAVASSQDGKAVFFKAVEESGVKGEAYVAPDPSWEGSFYEQWVGLSPQLADVDLRPVLHLSRDRALGLASYDELSTQAKKVLAAAATVDGESHALVAQLRALGEMEAAKLLKRLIRQARAEQWSDSSIRRCFNCPAAFDQLGVQLAAGLAEIPVPKVTTVILPLLAEKSWAAQLLAKWAADTTASPSVKGYFRAKSKKK
ncbi:MULTISPECIES: P-loop NTPase fold protein [unclassified Roseateles]|uniref:KAP family P-loop NTPase fold protein n=1 Tax=unclassified Roseateles TaxID=2626991 RepID=UPI0006FB6F52|nr:MULTISPECIES: P-loop NTPase fold protein [unclassified Roseateles]KQW43308.1 NTPase KAP [Pelomonas sp. Root405]KRA71046.1 NTPase KAP [Pelomonas sp. Root662]